MSSGTEYLQTVKEKIEIRLKEVEQAILDGQKEVEGMNDYYWENYTEMDEYGYENYDNQQALMHQIHANQEQIKTRRRLVRMLDAPFFGRVDFRYEEEEAPETFYIGIANFSDKRGGIPLIYDWRAPVSSLFYDYDSGEAAYEAPGGIMHGEITSKWQYKIKKGKMVYEFESDLKIDDEILKQELGSSGDIKLKNIVRTIQQEQNQIIRNTKDKILVIQGAAGSGKTSAALHRIAYLLYHDRKNLKSSNILILSPNGVFSDYISHILPELGEEPVKEMSFDLFAWKELKAYVPDCEDRYHQIERMWRVKDEEAEAGFRQKQSKEFLREIEGFLIGLEDRLVRFEDVEIRRYTMTAEEILHLFYNKFDRIPLLSRMDAVMEYYIDSLETLQGRSLNEDELEAVKQKFSAMYVTEDLYVIYSWLMEECGYEPLPRRLYEKRYLKYEDVYPMLYLKYRLLTHTESRKVKHLVIDEMQDYSYLQYVILERMFSCRMTILGDRAQTMDDRKQDVLRFLPEIYGKTIRQIEINKSYRNTKEIAEYAGKITGIDDLILLDRHGKDVVEKKVSDIAEALREAETYLMTGEEGFETAAVLAMTEEEAKEVYCRLKEHREDVSYIDRDSSHFKKGVTVTTWYLAKGLEFDQVFTVCTGEDTPLARQARYICATRALHELYMYKVES